MLAVHMVFMGDTRYPRFRYQHIAEGAQLCFPFTRPIAISVMSLLW
jgi:hypothetical protein